MHGGAWLLEAFAVALLEASNVATLKAKARDIVYSYQRLRTNALRAGHSENFVHSITHFDLFPLPTTIHKALIETSIKVRCIAEILNLPFLGHSEAPKTLVPVITYTYLN
jgi:hypothetical protein